MRVCFTFCFSCLLVPIFMTGPIGMDYSTVVIFLSYVDLLSF